MPCLGRRGNGSLWAWSGNSLGWYTALQLSGCVTFEQGLDLVIGTGSFQRRAGQVGGQLVYPVLDDNWQKDDKLTKAVEGGIAAARAQGGFASLSIDLGGLVVLAADDIGMAALRASIPPITRGPTKFPLVLPAHSAFHTPLMEPMAQAWPSSTLPPFAFPPAGSRLLTDRQDLVYGRRQEQCVHGRRDRAAALREYTIGEQIRAPYHFGRSLEIALREWDPDAIVLLGPGRASAERSARSSRGMAGVGSSKRTLRRRRHRHHPC